MAIFAEVTENERIIYRYLRGIRPLLDYDASESQSMISIWFDLIEIGLSALYSVMATQNWPTLQRGFSAIAELLVYERIERWLPFCMLKVEKFKTRIKVKLFVSDKPITWIC